MARDYHTLILSGRKVKVAGYVNDLLLPVTCFYMYESCSVFCFFLPLCLSGCVRVCVRVHWYSVFVGICVSVCIIFHGFVFVALLRW